MELEPLRESIKSCPNSVWRRDYDSASTDKLLDLIISCDSELWSGRQDSPRIDALRAINWFANAALTTRGIAPTARTCLGTIHRKPQRFLHLITRQDAPYIDLQWIGFQHPDQVPTKWRGIRRLVATAIGATMGTSAASSSSSDSIVFAWGDPDEVTDDAFDAADRVIDGQASISRKCTAGSAK